MKRFQRLTWKEFQELRASNRDPRDTYVLFMQSHSAMFLAARKGWPARLMYIVTFLRSLTCGLERDTKQIYFGGGAPLGLIFIGSRGVWRWKV